MVINVELVKFCLNIVPYQIILFVTFFCFFPKATRISIFLEAKIADTLSTYDVVMDYGIRESKT